MPTHGLRPLTTGELVGGAFALWRRHFAVLVATAALVVAPATALQLVHAQAGAVLRSLLSLLAFVALTAQVSEAILGRQPTLPYGVGVGLRRFFSAIGALVGAGLVVSLVLIPAGVAAAAGIPLVRARLLAGTVSRSTVLLLIFGVVLLLVVVASKLAVRYFAVLQIVTIERARNFLVRSAALSEGAYWKINMVWLVGSLITGLPGLAVGVSQGVTTAFAHRGDMVGGLLPTTILLGWVVSALGLPFSASLMALLYYDQRVRKDGIDVEMAVPNVSRDASGLPPRHVIGR